MSIVIGAIRCDLDVMTESQSLALSIDRENIHFGGLVALKEVYQSIRDVSRWWRGFSSH